MAMAAPYGKFVIGQMVNGQFQQVVSLGPDCRTKFHIENRFGQYVARGGVFDWQGTPSLALIEYFKRDFTGVFELPDLVVVDGFVRNALLGTSHKHAFPPGMTEELLAVHYPVAKQRHDFSCKVTQKALQSGRSTLFLLGKSVPSEHLKEIEALIRRAHKGRRFEIVPAPDGDHDDVWSGDHAIWATHLSRFEFQPPLRVVARVQFRNLRRALRSVTQQLG
ncbi:hypothetical protein [Aminobacter sp. HY435]|uniref:hypothetical protein n=1 Tax=Aminobacter sp. HY435 TaxID=2970917 RepID=UPI0022B97377|nr:hypothetical protein [Aminobacter sp. HY435]